MFQQKCFRSVNGWKDAIDKLKTLYVNYFAQCEACRRELIISSEQKNDDCTYINNNEDNDSSIEREDENRFTFVRSIPDKATTTKSGMSES